MRLATCLYKLKKGNYHNNIKEMASIAQSAVCCIVIEVSELIIEMMWEEHVEKIFPNTVEELKTVVLDMEFEWQFH